MSEIESLNSLITDEFFREITESSFDIAAIFDPETKPLWANEKWRSIFGELDVKRSPFAAMHPDDAGLIMSPWKDLVIGKDTSKHIAFRLASPSGDYVHFDATGVRAQVGDNVLISVTARNVTPKKVLEEELEDEIARNEKLLKIMTSRNERMGEIQEQIDEKNTEK
jgi:PAS domain S-box-containing protein